MTEAERTVKSIAMMLGWDNVPPRETLERDINALKGRLQETSQRLAEMESSRYVPGDWHCPTCGFQLHKRVMRASDGAVGIDTREVQDICPNDGSSLVQTTWEHEAESSQQVAVQQMKRAQAAEAQLAERTKERDGLLQLNRNAANNLATLREREPKA